MHRLPAWMCLPTWTPCTLGWDGVEASSRGPDHRSRHLHSLPTPGKFQGASPGMVFPATRPIQEPPSHLIITWEFTKVSGSPCQELGRGGGGQVAQKLTCMLSVTAHLAGHKQPIAKLDSQDITSGARSWSDPSGNTNWPQQGAQRRPEVPTSCPVSPAALIPIK